MSDSDEGAKVKNKTEREAGSDMGVALLDRMA